MKQLKLAVIALFTLFSLSNVNAQDENNKWALGLGVNIVDFHLADASFGDNLKDHLGSRDWNFLNSFSRLTADRYLNNGFTLQFAGSVNKISTFESTDDVDFFYYSLGLNVKYDLNRLFGETAWFDPYVSLGGNYVNANDTGEGMLNAGVGFNVWMNDNLGINFNTGTNYNFADKVRNHIQSSLGLVVKFGGKDTDKDGIYDKDDACPEEYGLAEFNGCPDSDGDGIKDSDDACPNEPGLAAMNGCPDSDGDGVADKDDMCPNEPGTKANKGCPDADGDGVVDKDDKCPNEAGSSENNGCPWPDTDGDGVKDKDDKCPNEAGEVSNDGCPFISNAAKIGVDALAKNVLFNTNRATFKDEAKNFLDGVVKIMMEFPKAEFDINGYTDDTGSAKYNLILSERRAIAVRDYLVSKGVATTRLTAQGFGEGNPIDTNKTKEGRANNRRVEIKINN